MNRWISPETTKKLLDPVKCFVRRIFKQRHRCYFLISCLQTREYVTPFFYQNVLLYFSMVAFFFKYYYYSNRILGHGFRRVFQTTKATLAAKPTPCEGAPPSRVCVTYTFIYLYIYIHTYLRVHNVQPRRNRFRSWPRLRSRPKKFINRSKEYEYYSIFRSS